MWKHYNLLAVISLGISFNSFALDGNPCLNFKPVSEAEIYSMLLPIMTAKLTRTSRPLSFWRYGYRTEEPENKYYPNKYKEGTPVLSDEAFLNPKGAANDYSGPADPNRNAFGLLKRLADGSLYEQFATRDRFGHGAYSAADPLGSTSYYHGSLMEIDIPAGTKLINLSYNDSGEEYFGVAEEFATRFQCTQMTEQAGPAFAWTEKELQFVRNQSMSLQQMQGSTVARKALNRIYKKLGVIGISASWFGPASKYCKDIITGHGRMIIFTNVIDDTQAKAHILVDQIEQNPTQEKENLYRSAMDSFEAFDFNECSDTSYFHSICKADTNTDVVAFWHLYRGWAEHFYGIPKDYSLENLKKLQREKFEDLSQDNRVKIWSRGYGCQKGDW